jgi:hypothetical protein
MPHESSRVCLQEERKHGQRGKWSFLDTKGTMMIPATYGDAFGFRNGLVYVQVNGN